jgi:hypothetical protein
MSARQTSHHCASLQIGSPADLLRAESTGSDKQAADTGHSPGPEVGLAIGGHDGSLLILDRVGRMEFVVGLRSHTSEVLSVYLTDVDVEKLIEFLTREHD